MKYKIKIILGLISILIASSLSLSCVESIVGDTSGSPSITIFSPVSGDSVQIGKNNLVYTAEDYFGGEGIERYEIYLNSDLDTVVTVVDNQNPTLPLMIGEELLNTTISYQVGVFNIAGSSDWSDLYTNIFVRPNTSPPDAPDSLFLEKLSDSEVLLIWNDNSTNEAGFQIWRSIGNNQNYGSQPIATMSANSNAFADAGLALTTTIYFYKVRAVNTYGNSDYTEEVSTGNIVVSGNKPTNLVGEALGKSKVKLTWDDNSNNEVGFEIQISTATSSWSRFAAVSRDTEEYTVTGLTSLTTYSFRIGALTNPTVYSDPVTVTTARIDVEPPSQLVAEYDSTTQVVTLSWQINTVFANQSLIERKIGNSNSFTQIGTVDFSAANNNEYSDTDLTQNSVHTYRVRLATTEDFNTDYTNEVSVSIGKLPPIPPSTMTITELIPGTSFRLSWKDNSSNEERFEIFSKETSGGTYSLYVTVNPNIKTYDVSGLDPSIHYYFKVRAYNESGGESIFSNEVVTPIPAPTNLDGTASSDPLQIVLTWDDNSGTEKGFIIERRFAGGGAYTEVFVSVENVETYTDNSIFRGSSYEYRIKAYDNETESAYSSVLRVTVPSK
ncbi:MAG: fibronectin type III domain-containing protein [Melioribacteraceae bacterium]|nr:fibronectin type III domain-containing protein [Melioribacteraceae bacterium]MCF8265627.1 fibronectin type III domain-containing protein [Melioribacteraceae bacterium]MCF8412163.1 fibronectin type III domain-containing protein [Melioribacteraceae bacterium]MCF8431844.1 fibronectin type III domain-containing protein [Melioribacteraceae bacterium]